MKERLLNLALAVDQLLWVVLTLGNGKPDETISAAAWRMEQQGKLAGKLLRPVIDRLFWSMPQHCKAAFEAEKAKAQLPEEYK